MRASTSDGGMPSRGCAVTAPQASAAAAARQEVAPIEYTALVWGVGLDVALWGVLPDSVTWLGAAIIVASGLYLLRRERLHVESEHP